MIHVSPFNVNIIKNLLSSWVAKLEEIILPCFSGENTELKFELAEWLIHHGARKLVLLNDEENKGGYYMKKLNRILHRSKGTCVFSPASRLDTFESALQFLKETLRIGTVSSIFCVHMVRLLFANTFLYFHFFI